MAFVINMGEEHVLSDNLLNIIEVCNKIVVYTTKNVPLRINKSLLENHYKVNVQIFVEKMKCLNLLRDFV